MHAAQILKSEGSFAGLADLVPYVEINGLFAIDVPVDEECGRSENLDLDNVCDIADEGAGHRG